MNGRAIRAVTAVVLAAAACACMLTIGDLIAQGRPQATLTARPVEAVAGGARTTLTLDVELPAAIHVQSDKPRDPSLIPTVLTVTPPVGVTVISIRYPKASDLRQPGRKEPLAVFGSRFAIAVDVAVARDVAASSLAIPATLRYQACNDETCFIPTRGQVTWSLEVKTRGRATAASTRTR